MISLYGDSYVDDYVIDSTINPWTRQLGDVHNYGQCGTGTEYALSQLRSNGGNPVVFILGNSDRLPLHDLPPKHQVDISNSFYFNLNQPIHPDISNYVNTHREHIRYMYRCLSEYIKHRTEEVIAYLSYYSTLHSTRVIAIPTTPLATSLPRRLNHNLFSLYPYNLSEVSHNEYTAHTDPVSHGQMDYRQNHLSQCNHDILASNISRMLDGYVALEHEHTFLDGHSPNKYIYE